MSKRSLTVYPLVFFLGALLLGLAVNMWSSDRIFYSCIGATAVLIMASAVLFGRQYNKLERLEMHLRLQGYVK